MAPRDAGPLPGRLTVLAPRPYDRARFAVIAVTCTEP